MFCTFLLAQCCVNFRQHKTFFYIQNIKLNVLSFNEKIKYILIWFLKLTSWFVQIWNCTSWSRHLFHIQMYIKSFRINKYVILNHKMNLISYILHKNSYPDNKIMIFTLLYFDTIKLLIFILIFYGIFDKSIFLFHSF